MRLRKYAVMSDALGWPKRPHRQLGSLSGWVVVVAGLQAIALVATSTRYGYHGDEFYFIVAGSHPAFGYPDQPPLVPLLSWLMHDLAPGSLLVLRLPQRLPGFPETARRKSVRGVRVTSPTPP